MTYPEHNLHYIYTHTHTLIFITYELIQDKTSCHNTVKPNFRFFFSLQDVKIRIIVEN